jgi:hypothetical protein
MVSGSTEAQIFKPNFAGLLGINMRNEQRPLNPNKFSSMEINWLVEKYSRQLAVNFSKT